MNDKALEEAIEWLATDVIVDARQKRYLSDNGFHQASLDRRIRMGETVLAALRAARQEVAQLQEWKRQQLEVWSSWDVQAVGKLLGLPLGKAIHPSIAPGIEALQAEVKELRKDKERLSGALEKCFWHFNKEIKRMPITESASTGTQTISWEIAQVLDKSRAAGEGKGAT